MYERRFHVRSSLRYVLHQDGKGKQHLHGPAYYAVGAVICAGAAACALALGEWGGSVLLGAGALLNGIAAARQRQR